ncbi:MAG: hypothetical protein AAB874_04610 [Patescibacteria group bacterium]|mgnify:CR=1 FL=1
MTRLKIAQLKNTAKHDAIAIAINRYLNNSQGHYSLQDHEFGAQLALGQARKAFLSGNYGIGAALFVKKNDRTEIYLGQNKVVTGKPSERFNTHGETDAIKHWLLAIEKKRKPHKVYLVTNKQIGVWLYTNLEPCPKCEMEITMLLTIAKEYLNPTATIHCICTATEGMLTQDQGVNTSNGSAHAVGKKHLTTPLIWRSIQRGYFSGQKPIAHPPVKFSLLNTSSQALEKHEPPGAYIHTGDTELVNLSWDIFNKTREKIDKYLAGD